MPGPAMMTFKTRERTVCIDINGAHPEGKASWQEWSDFLDEDLGVDPLEVKEVGVHTLTRLLMLQTMSDNEYQQLLSKLQEGVYWKTKDVTVYGWSHKEQLTTVKLMNVTGSLNIDLLRSKIEEYGKVVSWTLGKHPRYKNSFDNTITVKMMLKHEIKLPSFLPSPSTGEVIHLLSDSIGKACVRCLQSGHIAPYCRRSSKQFTEKTASKVWSPLPDGASTYATVASKSAQVETDHSLETMNSEQAIAPSATELNKEASNTDPNVQTVTEKDIPRNMDLDTTKGAFVEIETAGIMTPGGSKQTNWAEEMEMETPKAIHPPSKLPEKTNGSKRNLSTPSPTENFRPKRTASLSQEEKQAREKLQAHAQRKNKLWETATINKVYYNTIKKK